MQLEMLAARPAIVGLALLSSVAVAPSMASADGVITTRGVYYKERSTRVVQPMLDAVLEVGDHGEVSAHTLVDAISSASIAAGAADVTFDEKRYQYGGGYMHTIGLFRVGGNARYSSEPDYQSIFGSLRGEVELGQRNTTLGLTVAGGHDEISNEGAQGGIAVPVEGSLNTLLGSFSLSQIISPLVIVGLTYDAARLSGFQENPYRLVIAGGGTEPERVPDERLRHALFSSVRAYVPASKTAVLAGYRFYIDDWGIIGHTPELRLVQEVVEGFEVHGRYRFHRQSAADFYEEIYDTADPNMEPYITDDDKLGALRSQTFGFKLSSALSVFGVGGHFGGVRALLGAEYITQTTHFGNAISAQLAIAVPIAY